MLIINWDTLLEIEFLMKIGILVLSSIIIILLSRKLIFKGENPQLTAMFRKFLFQIIILSSIIAILFFADSFEDETVKNTVINIGKMLIFVMSSFIFSSLFETFLIRNQKYKQKLSKTPNILLKLGKFIIFIIAIMMLLSSFSIDITPLIATLGISSIAIGLAIKTPLESFLSGLYVIATKPVSIGDYIEIGGSKGFVDDIKWTGTRLRSYSNDYFFIPNIMFISSPITNYSLNNLPKSVSLKLGISQNEDINRVYSITKELADDIQKNSDFSDNSKDSTVLWENIGDFTIDLNIILKSKDFKTVSKLKDELVKRVMIKYQEENIDMPPPIHRIEKS
ncbi:mechanosensitive ion channel family protein [Candidatus Lokiarchaeum ossiferum]|uniref:mechanosensitive ion channel family protein n=1 Tax=Candidatus Lokiarchaeum ossiferum TaxID=2951803 RepID=UPI00352C0D03